jgi:hypothetical protein
MFVSTPGAKVPGKQLRAARGGQNGEYEHEHEHEYDESKLPLQAYN